MNPMKKAKSLSPEKQEEITRQQWNRYIKARDNGHLDYIDMAKKCDAFYCGDQWDSDDIATLEEEGRPALTTNTILPTVNTILGEQSTRRADIQFKARRSGTEEVAATLNKLYAHIADNNKLDWVEQTVFSDGLIMDGRGYFDVRLDFSDHLEGEVRITAKDPLDILIDPDAKEYDPKTWNEVFETRWMTLDEIEEVYGKKKAAELKFIAENGNSFGRDSVEYEEQRFGADNEAWQQVGDNDDYKTAKSLRVIERQYRKLVRSDFYLDPNTGDQRLVPEGHNDAKAKKFAKKYGLGIVSKVIRKVRWTVTCDKVVLHDDWSPYEDFTIVPFFCYFRRGKPFGVIRNLLSPQEQLNKIDSQMLHIVNTTANSGWMIESGSLIGMNPDDLEENGSKTGLVLEYAKGFMMPQKIQPNQIPTGLDRIAQKVENKIQSISGVSESMLGSDSPEVSGVAIQAKQNRGAIMIQVPLDNLRKSRQYLAEKVLNIVQRFYTEERIIQVTKDDDPLEVREEMVINQETPEGTVINDLTLGEYDVIVSTAPARDSFDEVQFAEMMSMRQVGIEIPDDAVVSRSHLEDKGPLAKRIRVRNGEEPPTEEQMQAQQEAAEVEKQSVMGQLEKMSAEVEKLRAETELFKAKIVEITELNPARAAAELEQKSDESHRNDELRRELGDKSNQSRQLLGEIGSATKLATGAMTQAVQTSKEENQPKDKPKDKKD
jgi:hypothetical protein